MPRKDEVDSTSEGGDAEQKKELAERKKTTRTDISTAATRPEERQARQDQ